MNESEIKNVVDKMVKKFEKGGLLPKAKFEDGGIIKCLKGGKTYAECKKCGGKTPVVKNQEPADKLRARGTAPSSAGIFQPDMVNRDALWFKNNGANVRNQFTGDDLTQYFITSGFYGTPRLQKRVITNYNTPALSDTTYVDGNGITTGHSKQYMNDVNKILQGAEPYATSGKEVRDMKKKR